MTGCCHRCGKPYDTDYDMWLVAKDMEIYCDTRCSSNWRLYEVPKVHESE